MVAGPLKSKKAYRTIGIPAFLCEELAIHLTEYPSGSDLVFSHAQGGPLDYNRFRRRHWNPAVEASVGPPCTPHDLRHTHVAMLIAENQSPSTSLTGSDTRALGQSSTCMDTSTRALIKQRWRVSTGSDPKLRRTPHGHQTGRTSCRLIPSPGVARRRGSVRVALL